MFYRKLMIVAASAVLGGAFAQQAGAWGTGGSIGSPLKTSFADLQMFCDLSDPRSTLTIRAEPSNADPTVRPSFILSGQMVCAEVPYPGPLSLNYAIDLSSPASGKAIGLFQLSQIPAVPADNGVLFPGLTYSGPDTATDGTRTWTFTVTGHESFPFAELLYKLAPANVPSTDPNYALAQQARLFCNPNNLGVSGAPPVLGDSGSCEALFGLQLPVKATDYPDGRMVNGITLSQGEVFTFSTITQDGVEKGRSLAWAPCHTGRFVDPKQVQVNALENNAAIVPVSSDDIYAGNVMGDPVSVDNPTTESGNRNTLFVTVQPNDLWNSGPIPLWSNADGLVADLYTDAYKATDPVSGENYVDQLDPEVAVDSSVTTYCTAHPSNCSSGIPDQIGQDLTGHIPYLSLSPRGPGSFAAPVGELVGRVDGSYYELGTHRAVDVPEGYALELFYWDKEQPVDNSGSVKVTVATDRIMCADSSGHPIPPTTGTLRTVNSVNVESQSTLNVKNKSTTAAFPVTIIGCSNYDPSFLIQTDGSPIISGDTEARINGTVVPIKNYSVADTFSRPSCDGGQPLLDLTVSLNQASVIGLLAPGAKCTNGPDVVRLEVGSDTNGWYGGNFTVKLNKCK